MMVRAALVGLIILALVDPPITSRSGEVTAVFVVDVSDSMRDTGRDSARAWVESAVADAGSGHWAVVEFGADARTATPFGSDTYRRARGVDGEATSLARGLRLGESLLTGETRERIILVSDGRSNTGDLQAEVNRLRDLDVVVDVQTITPSVVTDAAVSAIDLPSSVNTGVVFEVTVEVLSTIAGPATVGLTQGAGPGRHPGGVPRARRQLRDVYHRGRRVRSPAVHRHRSDDR